MSLRPHSMSVFGVTEIRVITDNEHNMIDVEFVTLEEFASGASFEQKFTVQVWRDYDDYSQPRPLPVVTVVSVPATTQNEPAAVLPAPSMVQE